MLKKYNIKSLILLYTIMSITNKSIWTTKIVLHRGWHRENNNDQTKPLENTRQAYILAAKLNVAYAECDVWETSDGKMVLCHSSSFKEMVKPNYLNNANAIKPINTLSWNDIKVFELLDGSNPVLLSTVMTDLKETNTRLAIDLKCSNLAKPLALFLFRYPELISTIGFIMGFALDSGALFRENLPDITFLWLVDNPSSPYNVEDILEGETTFNYLEQSVGDFLKNKPAFNAFDGMYIQYRPGLTSDHVLSMRLRLADILGRHPTDVFIGLWSDSGLDPEFDFPGNLQKWESLFDAINTDCFYMDTLADVPDI
jgi:glycerophosphoryl diester phosphodiesterase